MYCWSKHTSSVVTSSWQTWHVWFPRNNPAVMCRTIAFLQKTSAFVSVCATLKKRWRKEWNVHGKVMTWWLKSCCSRGWKMWSSYFCDYKLLPSPLCYLATHMTPKTFKLDWLFLHVYSLPVVIAVKHLFEIQTGRAYVQYLWKWFTLL